MNKLFWLLFMDCDNLMTKSCMASSVTKRRFFSTIVSKYLLRQQYVSLQGAGEYEDQRVNGSILIF